MRRTYRSKKETGGGLDPRDVVLTMDEKSSVFDAFYIQNIKQTKRELSVGPSIYIASNKVNKRKYVKRLKEQELALKQPVSGTDYLTPDKSLRVKKAPDPFDQLLNSSSPNQKSPQLSNKIINQTQIQRQKKIYQKKKLPKKIFNYSSSDTTGSDKENSVYNHKSNSKQNISDVLSHNLLIEKEKKNSTDNIDESVYNIATELFQLKKIKDSNCLTPNLSPNIKDKIPSLQNSPLCSTPYQQKYRGKSIFKFSPISFDAEDDYENINTSEKRSETMDKNYVAINDVIDIIETDLNKTPHTVRFTSGVHIDSLIKRSYDNDECCSPILGRTISNSKDDSKQRETKKQSPLKFKRISAFHISQEEPFLGFSESKIQTINNLETVTNKYKEISDSLLTKNSLNNEICLTQTSSDLSKLESGNANSFRENVYNENMIKEVDLTNKFDESQSFLDLTEPNEENSYNSIKNYQSKEAFTTITNTNNIEEDLLGQNKYSVTENPQIILKKSLEEASGLEVKEVKVDIDLEVSTIGDDKVNQHSTIRIVEESVGFPCLDGDSINESEYQQRFNEEETLSSFETNESLYESCNSENFSMNDHDLSTEIEHPNDSAFQKHFTSLVDSSSESDKTCNSVYSNEQSLNDDTSENDTILERAPSSYADFSKNTVINMSCVEENPNDNSLDNTLLGNSSISFVTTRKKNKITKDSFILSFESSFSSAYSCDSIKTQFNNTKDNIKENDVEENYSNAVAIQIFDRDSLLEIDKNIASCNSTELSAFPNLEGDLSKSRQSVASRSSLKTRKSSFLSRTSVNRPSVAENSLQKSRNSKHSTQFNTEKVNKKSSSGKVESIPLSKCDINCSTADELPSLGVRYGIVLEPGKRWERSLSIYRRMTTMNEHFDHSILDEEPLNSKGRKYRQSVISTMEMQNSIVSLHNESLKSCKSNFLSKPNRSTIKIVRESNASRISLCSTSVSENLQGFLTEDCDDTIVELSKLSIIDSEHEVTVLDKFNDTSNRITTARDYILRRCNQTDVILFDECYPNTVLKNCRKIGEGVYGEVFLWRARDGRARVLKIVPIAGAVKVNGESQKDYDEVISEIVIAMELSALRAPIEVIEKHLDEGKGVETLDLHSVENATDVFNEVLAVRCVYGNYPSRLLDLWELYDECKGSDNDNPAVLPVDQQFMVLELANAGQDLEGYQFNNAEQAYAVFQQVAYGLAVAEESFQFEHRDLHWGNVLISPTDQKFATFVLRGQTYRVLRRGVAATVIDYSLSRLSLPSPPSSSIALYNDLGTDDGLFDAVGDYQFEVYRLMREKLGNDWKNFEPYTNILWLHYTVDKMITALRYTRTNTKIHKHYIARLKQIKNRILDYGSAVQYILIDNEL